MQYEKEILQALGLETASEDTQQEVVANVESIIEHRLVLMLDEMLTDTQRAEFKTVQADKGDVEARLWLEANVANTQELYHALMTDYLNEKKSQE